MLRLSIFVQAAIVVIATSASAQALVLTGACQDILAKARSSTTPAAFAASPEGKCGASFNYASTVAEAQSRAVQWCRQGGGKRCAVRFTKR